MPSGTSAPHPFVLSFANTGRGPNESSLPFQNSGYTINNNLHSFALELNSRASSYANRFFASYNRFRDHRTPFSAPFPTVEIGEGGRHLHHRWATSRSRSTTSWTRTSCSSPTTSRCSRGATRSPSAATTSGSASSTRSTSSGTASSSCPRPSRRAAPSARWTSSSPRPTPGSPTVQGLQLLDRERPLQGREHRRRSAGRVRPGRAAGLGAAAT